MIRFIIFVYIAYVFFQKIYQVLQKRKELYKEEHKHFFKVQIADTENKREQGLMFIKKKLPSDQGMLFKYDEKIMPKLWMKNTFIPLDILFLDNKGMVVDLVENMKTLSKKTYKSKNLCNYALEINANTINKMGIKIGHYIGTTLLNDPLVEFDKRVLNLTKKDNPPVCLRTKRENKDKKNDSKNKKNNSKNKKK